MTFPKISKTIDDTVIEIEKKFLVEKHTLTLDRLKCTGCGQCSIVCPKEVINFGPASALYEENPNFLNSGVINSIKEEDCVYCGTCVYFCPFDALHLSKNGERVEIKDMQIDINRSIPTLKSEKVFCSNIKREADVYWEGTIDVSYDIPEDPNKANQDYLNKCPGDCQKCLQICPTDAITFNDAKTAFETKVLFKVDDDKCIKCSACMLVCPQSYFDVKWTEIHVEGAYNALFWDPIRERLLKQEVRFTPND